MHIEIVIDTNVIVGSREGHGVPLADVASELADVLPSLLTQSQSKVPPVTMHDVQVSLYQFGKSEPIHPMIHITVRDVDPAVHHVPVMPYDKVWRVITGWFNDKRLVFPLTFRYDTGEHGMISYAGEYRQW